MAENKYSQGVSDDLTKSPVGGFQRELPEAGIALLRLRDYIELGPQKAKNPAWSDAIDVMLTFELLHPKHMIKPEGSEPFPQILSVRVNKAAKDTSTYKSLFKAMNWSGLHSHFVTMLGDAYLGEVYHVTKDKKTYINLQKDKVWSMKAPRIVDPLSGTVTEVPVPELHGTPRAFLWEEAGWSDELYLESWNSLYIDGTTTDGKSKNWIQESIMGSTKWEGSRIQALVQNGHLELPGELTGENLEKLAANQAPADDDIPFDTNANGVSPLSDAASEQANALAAMGLS